MKYKSANKTFSFIDSLISPSESRYYRNDISDERAQISKYGESGTASSREIKLNKNDNA